jgi:peroxiredoxin Q/BCP
MQVDQGQEAPDFTLPRDGGGTLTLSAYRGRPVVLFSYSEAGTPTCTQAAKTFSDHLAAFQALGAVVIGISPDPVAKQNKFRDKHGLTIPLLSDDGHAVLESWGVWVEKQMYGNRYMGVERTTWLIDAQGRVAQVWRKVRQKGHVEAVLAAVKAL